MARKSKNVIEQAAKEMAAAGERQAQNGKAAASPSNVTDETIRAAMDGIFAAHADLKKAQEAVSQANGIYRNKIKAAGKIGLNKDAIIEVIRLKSKEPGDEVSKLKSAIRYARVMGLPIGTQLDIFGDTLEAAEVLPYNAGRAAAENREPATNNPHEPGSEAHQDWSKGFGDWMFEHAPSQLQAGASN